MNLLGLMIFSNVMLLQLNVFSAAMEFRILHQKRTALWLSQKIDVGFICGTPRNVLCMFASLLHHYTMAPFPNVKDISRARLAIILISCKVCSTKYFVSICATLHNATILCPMEITQNAFRCYPMHLSRSLRELRRKLTA